MTDLLSLDGKRALVTGASSGLGPIIATALDAAGASVGIHYHQNLEGAESLAATLTNPTTLLQSDLSQLESVASLFEAAAPVNILVNCAAAESQNVEDLDKLDSELWRNTQQTNVEAPLVLIQKLAEQRSAAAVINISSIEGSRPAPGHGHYSTSKAALEMLTKSAALEFGPIGLRVNAIAPGLIWRDGIEEGWPEGVKAWNAAAPLGRLVQPDDIASAVVFLSSDAAASITGIVLTIDCGLSIKPGW